jgi:dimethylargininase
VKFARAITRTPSFSFADGLTAAGLGVPDVALARRQHDAYVQALRRCGLEVEVLPAVEEFPDSTFVEDPAVPFEKVAVLCRPGASSRRGEVAAIEPALSAHFNHVATIAEPGQLDGGDVMVVERDVFVGLSGRTDEAGVAQLAAILTPHGYTVTGVRVEGSLHLKSDAAYLGNDDLVITGPLCDDPSFARYHRIELPEVESYAANCVRINDHVVLPDGFPKARGLLEARGYGVIVVDVSEFQKMDGGLSCLSLRF